MQVDWLTTSAQIVNFLILIVLLQKFLYRPILRAIKAREQTIADKLREAEEARCNSERLAERYRIKEQELEDQRASLLDQAKREIEDQRASMIEQLREEVHQKRLAWYRDFAEEKNSARADIKALLGDKIMKLSRRALSDLAGADLERQMIRRFLEQIGQIPETEHRQWVNALSGAGRIQVWTHFDVTGEDAQLIEQSLSGAHPGLRIDFQTSRDILCGIVVETEGYSWSWTFDRYLEEFEESFSAPEPHRNSQRIT